VTQAEAERLAGLVRQAQAKQLLPAFIETGMGGAS
jgi:hypothetical protein